MRGRALIVVLVAGALVAQPLLQAGLSSGAVRDALQRVAAQDRSLVKDAEAAAAPRLPVGELTDKRTRTSKTERARDGKVTTTLSTTSMNYQDARGKWQPIDSRLVASNTGGYQWVNAANRFRSLFKSQLDGDYLRLDVNRTSFHMSLEGAGRKRAGVTGSTVEYDGIFADTNLRYNVGADQVKETLVLGSAKAPATYRFILSGPRNMRIQPSAQFPGAFEVWLPGLRPAFLLDAPEVVEAPGGHSRGQPDPTPARLAVTRVTEGRYELALSLDPAWLGSPSRQFPVLLDPGMNFQPDALDRTFKTCSGCGGSQGPLLAVGADNSFAYRSGIRFDLSGLPMGANATGASLQVIADSANNLAGSHPANSLSIEAHRITSQWDATSSMPTFDSTVLEAFTVQLNTPGTTILSYNVGSAVLGWLSGAQPNYGILLKASVESLRESGLQFYGASFTGDQTLTPRLSVTYATDAPSLLQPNTLHSNGAELHWTPYSPASGAPFQKWEVHRSTVANFTPSASTLLTSIGDVSTTSYRDTTAAPGGTYSYAVVANSSASQQVRVTLPADGKASKVLQPASKDVSFDSLGACSDGVAATLAVGHDSIDGAISRALVAFDLHDLNAHDTIDSAVLTLHTDGVSGSGTVNAHRVTGMWEQGVGGDLCDGADWGQARSGVPWTAPGGDFDPSSAASVSVVSSGPTAHQFDLKSLVQLWASGQAPNLGVIVEMDAGPIIGYASSERGLSDQTEPLLTVNYSEDVHAIAPTVAVAVPAAGTTVRGTAGVSVSATDDRRVDRVELFADGSSVGTALSPPFSFTWNTTGLSNGQHNLTATATDDAGNTATSAAVAVTVNNRPAPTTAITSPANNASVTGVVTVSTSNGVASGLSISKVELAVDGAQYGVPATAAPYSLSWNTLDAAQPAFDGTHTLTSRITDSSGQVVDSAPITVTVANTASSRYVAGLTTPAGAVPQTMSFDPAISPQLSYPVNVTVTNNSGVAWSASTTFLRYRWYTSTSTTPVFESVNLAGLGLAPGANTTVAVQVTPPTLGDGVNQAQFQLRFDVFDTGGGPAVAFADRGNPPLDNPVIVNKVLKTKLGLEHFYQYVQDPVGAGMTHWTNVANGNSLLTLTPMQEPGRGLSTVVDLTYNSLEDHSESPAGNNWSLSISSLTRLGQPLDIHPNNADTIAGRSNKFIEFVDADGTLQHFDGVTGGDGVTFWKEPPGVHLYLRSITTNTQDARYWAITRPDRTTFFFNADGYPTYVRDRNGNEISFTLTSVQPGDDPGGPKFHVTKVTDATGQGGSPAPHRSFDITYFTKATAKKPQVRGKIATITDHLGQELDFSYYDDGNLLGITEKGSSTVDGSALARSRIFTYTTSDGSGPAIPNAGDRVNPDPKTANESTRIYSVRDPLGHETLFTYDGPTTGQDRWKLAAIQDRAGAGTTFTYDDVNLATTVAAPTPSGQTARTAVYAYDVQGRPTSIRDPLGQQTSLQWSADNAVTRLTEPNTRFQQFTYNDNGQLTDQVDQVGDHTVLTYQNLAADANDVSAHWNPSGGANGTGRTIPHLSQLATKEDPREVAGSTGKLWQFTYDTNGNLTQVTEPLFSNPAVNHYNADGTLANSADFNGNLTTYASYDANGLPTKVVDATDNPANPTHFTLMGYDDGGRPQFVQDPNHAQFTAGTASQYQTQFFYDGLGRPARQTTPKSTTLNLGTLIVSSATYDANDNLLTSTAPHCLPEGDCRNPEDSQKGTVDVTNVAYDVMDRPTLVTGPDTSADPAGERTRYQYDVAGRVTQVTLPLGVQNGTPNNTHTVNYAYDALDRVTAETRVHDTGGGITQALTTLSCYDTVGNLVSVTTPRSGLGSITCPGTTANPFTTVYAYDDAHRLTSVTAPLTNDGQHHQTQFAYDENGSRTRVTDAKGNTTVSTYDALGRLVQVCQPFMTGSTHVCTPGSGHPAVTVLQYDANGNLTRQASPRGYDASSDKQTFTDFATGYHYDALNRLVRTDLPVQGASTPFFVHQAYDFNGNLVSSSLPVTQSDPGQVAASSKTQLTYFDPGWIASSQDPGSPRVHFDYTGKGEQRLRTPESGSGSPQIQWFYFSDGLLKERRDPQGQPIKYTYDAENHLTASQDASGLTTSEQTLIDTQSVYDDLGRLVRSDLKKQTETNWTFSTFAYDADGNVSDQVQNGLEGTPGGTLVRAGRSLHTDYDGADWITFQFDFGTDPGSSDDQRTKNDFTEIGLEKRREIDKSDGSGGWTAKQVSNWDYFDNGKLKTLNTTNGAVPPTTLESHIVGYLDPISGSYVDGNRTSDSFTLKPAGGSSGACYPAVCNASYGYDPRDRLTSQNDGHGTTTTYDVDPLGNIQDEKVGTTITKQYDYQGTPQLRQLTAGGVVSKYWYDDIGRLHCVTTSAGSAADCTAVPSGASTNLLADYEYDYLDRLASYQAYSGGGQTDNANYTYDALNRLATEQELHPSFNGDKRTTQFSYLGLGGELTQEQQTNSTGVLDTKDYSYDAYGHRLSQTTSGSVVPGVPNGTSTYGYDVHGSVSQLIDANGNSQASYGYKAYGQTDSALTQGENTNQLNPINAFRYGAARSDTGSGTVDMGARRFGPDVSRFLTPDLFFGALSNLSLSLDPITQNRYGLAGGNPISFREWNGHVAVTDGGGGADTTPNPETGLTAGTSQAPQQVGWQQFVGGWLQVIQSCQNQISSCGQTAEQQLFGTANVDLVPHGGGLSGGATVEFSTISGPAAGGTATGEVGTTFDQRAQHHEFIAGSAGGFTTDMSNLNQHESYPGQPDTTPGHDPMAVAGLFAGIGLSANISNAHSAEDLAGPFTQYSLSVGIGDALSVQLSVGQNAQHQGIYNLSISPKEVPIGAGAGASASAYDTNTWVTPQFDAIEGIKSEVLAWPVTLPGIPELARRLASW